jgi:hypothetical protein
MRETYSEKQLRSFEIVDDLGGLTADDWSAYRETVVKPNTASHRPVGRYAVTVRKREHERRPSDLERAEP